ncbi:MAG: hypothetical protein R3C32_06160 [Chloroflexota bacterium]
MSGPLAGVAGGLREIAADHPGAARAALHALVVLCVRRRVAAAPTWPGRLHPRLYACLSQTADPYRAGVGSRTRSSTPAVAQALAVPATALGRRSCSPGAGCSWAACLRSQVVVSAALPLPPVLFDIIVGNVHILYAAAIVLGFRFPWTWSLMVSPWCRPLGITMGSGPARPEGGRWRLRWATGATVAVSYLMVPDLWRRWVDLLVVRRREAPALALVHVPCCPGSASLRSSSRGARSPTGRGSCPSLLSRRAAGHHAGRADTVGILPLRGAAGRGWRRLDQAGPGIARRTGSDPAERLGRHERAVRDEA